MSNKPVLVEDILKEIGLHHFVDVQDLSDGSHTFEQLYDHRSILFMSLVKALLEGNNHFKFIAFKSKLHADGTSFDGYFLLMLINTDTKEQISYHLETNEYWHMCPGKEVKSAPEWDSHTSDNVVERLISWFL